MKVLVYEYVTGGGPIAPSSSLAGEGALMLGALLDDLAEIPGVRPMVMLDRLAPVVGVRNHTTEWLRLAPGEAAQERFLTEIHRVDAVWPIAPETGGVLERLCLAVEAAEKALLTSPSRAVGMTASKLKTVTRLASQGVPVIPTQPCDFKVATPHFAYPIVVKADDGAGCEDSCIIRGAAQWESLRHGSDMVNPIMQPLVAGESLSLSGLFAHGEARLLSVNRQHIDQQLDRFQLNGCSVNALTDREGQFTEILKRTAAAFPELWGYAGIDLLMNEAGLWVLEINPRLTSSYAGLRSGLGVNPASLVMDLHASGRLPTLPARPLNPVELTWGQIH